MGAWDFCYISIRFINENYSRKALQQIEGEFRNEIQQFKDVSCSSTTSGKKILNTQENDNC